MSSSLSPASKDTNSTSQWRTKLPPQALTPGLLPGPAWRQKAPPGSPTLLVTAKAQTHPGQPKAPPRLR